MHVIHLDGPGGGPKTVLAHLTFYSTIFDVKLVHGGRGMLAKACEDLGVPNAEIPLGKLRDIVSGAVRLAMEFFSYNPDIVILHGQWAAFAGAFARVVCPKAKILYVAQWPAFYTDWDLRRLVRNFLLEYAPLKSVDIVVAISPGNRDEYLRRYPWAASKIRHIPNSIDMNTLPDEREVSLLREEFGWRGPTCHVACVGRLSTQKRVDWLLESWKMVEDSGADAMLWIVGDGEEGQNLRDLAAKLELKQCTFLGAKAQGSLYLAACDIVAMPSMYEGHANVPLEAMACGRPIVASEVDGVAETFQNGVHGWLVPPGDRKMFAERILDLVRDPELRRKMGDNGMQQVVAFERGTLMKRYLELVFELLGSDDDDKSS